MVIAQTNITGYWVFFDMVTHKIVVIRGREISVIFYYSVFQALVTSDNSIPLEYTGICGRELLVSIRIRTLPVVGRHLG